MFVTSGFGGGGSLTLLTTSFNI